MTSPTSSSDLNKKKLIRSQVFNLTTITFFGQFASWSILSIFILFLTLPMAKDGLGMTEKEAYQFMGVTQAIGYLMPFMGGYIIDKYLGIRRGIMLGISLLAVAYGIVYLASSYVHIFGNIAFIAAYALIPVINSLTISPSSALVSQIYKDDKVGSKSGMTFYYMAINVGSLIGIGLAPLLMKSPYGVLSVLGVVVIGKSIAALNFAYRYKLYDNVIENLDRIRMTWDKVVPVIIYLVFGYALAFLTYLNPYVSTYIIGIGCLLGISAFFLRTLMLKSEDKIKQLVATLLIVVAIIFFVLYNQMSTTMILFTKNNTDHLLFGMKLEAAHFQMINPLVIILIGAALPRFYRKFSGFTIPYQFSVGIILSGLSMLVLWYGSSMYFESGIVSANYVGLSYLIVTIAELFVSAIGLSMIGIYCHSSMIAFAMGAWYLASSMSNLITGQLGKIVAIPHGNEDKISSLHSYAAYYFSMGSVAVIMGFILVVIMFFLQKYLKNKDIQVV